MANAALMPLGHINIVSDTGSSHISYWEKLIILVHEYSGRG